MSKEEINSLNQRIISILREIEDLHSKDEGKKIKNSQEIVRLSKSLITFSQREMDSQEGLSREDITRQFQLLAELYKLVEQDTKELDELAGEVKRREEIESYIAKISALKVTPELEKKIKLGIFKTSMKNLLKKKGDSVSTSDLYYEIRMKYLLSERIVQNLNSTPDISKIKNARLESAIQEGYKKITEERVAVHDKNRVDLIADMVTRQYIQELKSETTSKK